MLRFAGTSPLRIALIVMIASTPAVAPRTWPWYDFVELTCVASTLPPISSWMPLSSATSPAGVEVPWVLM